MPLTLGCIFLAHRAYLLIIMSASCAYGVCLCVFAAAQNFFLIFDLRVANCGAFLVQFFAVQLVALHAESSAYERIQQKAAKQGYWKLYVVAFCVELNVTFLNKPNMKKFSHITTESVSLTAI